MRLAGPETEIAARTASPGPNTGALTDATPGARSLEAVGPATPSRRRELLAEPSCRPPSTGGPHARKTLPAEPWSSGSAAPTVDDRAELVLRSRRRRRRCVDRRRGRTAARSRRWCERAARALDARAPGAGARASPRSRAQQSRAERVAEPADVEEVAVVFRATGSGDAPSVWTSPVTSDDVRERSRARLDGVHHGGRTVDDADGRVGARVEAPAGRRWRHPLTIPNAERVPRFELGPLRVRFPGQAAILRVPDIGTQFHYMEQDLGSHREVGRPEEDRNDAPDARGEGVGAPRRPSPRGEPDLLYVDLHLVHEVTSPQAFDALRSARPHRPPPRPHGRDDGSQRPDHRRSGHRRGERSPDAGAPTQHRRFRHHACTPGERRVRASCT